MPWLHLIFDAWEDHRKTREREAREREEHEALERAAHELALREAAAIAEREAELHDLDADDEDGDKRRSAASTGSSATNGYT